MIHIFYFVGILFIIYKFNSLINISKRVEDYYKLLEQSKANKGLDWSNMTETYKTMLISKGCVGIIFILWVFIGLMTFNWVAFGIFILIQYVLFQPIMKKVKYTLFYGYMYFFNILLGLSLGIFVLLNHYHLRIDLQVFINELYKSLI